LTHPLTNTCPPRHRSTKLGRQSGAKRPDAESLEEH
jgi:hypothetical protein